MSKKLIWAFLLVSFVGFLDATYLTVEHYSGGSVSCSVLEGCNEVLGSQYSVLFGIPLALYGVLFYLSIFFSALLLLADENKLARKYLSLAGPVGYVASLYFVYLQIFVIEALCQYCLLSAISSTLIFVFSLFLTFRD